MICPDCKKEDIKKCDCGWEERPLTTKEIVWFNLQTIEIALKTKDLTKIQKEGALQAIERIRKRILKKDFKSKEINSLRNKLSRKRINKRFASKKFLKEIFG